MKKFGTIEKIGQGEVQLKVNWISKEEKKKAIEEEASRKLAEI